MTFAGAAVIMSLYGAGVQAVMLWLQYRAWKRNGGSFLQHLVVASSLNILSIAVAAGPYVSPMTEPALWRWFLFLYVPLLLASSILAIWASARLFESYSQLNLARRADDDASPRRLQEAAE